MSISLYLYMNITLHFYLIHFIYLSISIFLYRSIRISLYFLRFSYSSLYGLLTVHSTIFSTVPSPLRFYFATVYSPPTVASLTANLTVGSTVPSTSFYTANSTVGSTVISIRFSLTILICSTILFSYSL